ncbi:MAG: choice-of-anchor E domain-containing protein [Phycisphaerae bacterium]|nr:choice-of-anchor E domain-containing protein [Phycisphaerae bacterium]
MKNVFAVASVLAIAAGASASFSEMEMQTQSWAFPLSPGNDTVTFNKFDTMGGTRVLKGVLLEIDGSMQASITAENNSVIPVNNFAVSLTGIVDINVGPLSGGLGIIANSPIVAVSATDNGGIPNGMGLDFHNFGTVSGNDSDSAFGFPLPIWIGPGTIMGAVSGSGGFAAQGTSDATINFDNFGASGTAKLTYFFDAVPTPGSAALLGLAGLVSIRRRRF